MTTTHSGNSWWLHLTCFFFFGGLSCFVPFLTAHLKWLGLNLQEIGVIQLITGVLSSLGWFIAASRIPRSGQRVNLALTILLAALCGAALLLIPRIADRLPSSGVKESPLAEILCRPEGSALFFHKCGDTCDLDADTQTELTISECRFEAESELPEGGDYIRHINRFGGSFTPVENMKSSGPERGDVPKKTNDVVALAATPLLVASTISNEAGESSSELDQPGDYPVTDYDAFNLEPNNSTSEPYDQYDYDRNHPELKPKVVSDRQKRNDYTSDVDESYQYEGTNNPEEMEQPPAGSSPHICFSRDHTSTTCHVFIGTDHQFRFNTSFYSPRTGKDRCFYSLRYGDTNLQVLSELRCRSNQANQQVRCRADGVTLRASVTKNETRTCRHHLENVSRSAYSYGSFWLYLLFRTVGEMAVIGAVILLYTVTFNYDIRRSCSEAPVQRCRSQTMWWISGLVALVLLAPVAGFINDTIGFGIGFLLGSLLFGLASLMIAISPTPTTPATPAPILSFASGQQQQQERQQSKLLDTQQVVPQPTLRQCLSVKGALLVLNYPVAVAILITVLFFGMASGVVSTALHWYFIETGASRSMLGASMSSMLICIPLVFLLSGWLWKRCGSHYIFIIGLLICSIRFLGFSLVERPIFMVIIETLEPLCSIWMLLAASAHIQRHLTTSSRIHSAECSLQVNSWALIIIFHYSFGRGVGGSLAALAAQRFGVIDVFIAAAVATLLTAAVWFTCLHAPTNCCSKRPEQSKKKDGSPAHRGGKTVQDRNSDSYTQLQDLKSAGSVA